MKEWFEGVTGLGLGWVDENSWIIQVFIIIFMTLIAHVFGWRVLDRIERKFLNTDNVWDDALITAVKKPLVWLIWAVGGLWAVDIVHQVSGEPIFSFVDPVRDVLVIFFLSWFLFRMAFEVENRLKDPVKMSKPVDQTTALALGKLIRLSIVITSTLVVLQTLGFSVSGVLAFGGIGGIAVGFAARDLLANFFGGLMIFLDRPFKVGDWILSPDKEIEGTVENIGWRLTAVRTFDKRPLYIPNAVFSSISVENPSRMSHRRIYETVGVRYADIKLVQPIVHDIKQMLIDHEEIDETQTLMVNLNDFGPSSVDFFIYTFTKTTNWVRFHEIKQDVLFRVAEIIDQHGAEIAFPTRTLHMVENTEEPALAGHTQASD